MTVENVILDYNELAQLSITIFWVLSITRSIPVPMHRQKKKIKTVARTFIKSVCISNKKITQKMCRSIMHKKPTRGWVERWLDRIYDTATIDDMYITIGSIFSEFLFFIAWLVFFVLFSCVLPINPSAALHGWQSYNALGFPSNVSNMF